MTPSVSTCVSPSNGSSSCCASPGSDRRDTQSFCSIFLLGKVGGSTWFNQQNDLDSTANFFCRCDQQNNYITRPKPKWTGLVRNFSGLNISFFEVAMSISSSSSARYVLKSSLQFHWARKKLLKQGPPSIPLRSKRAVGFPSSLETHPTQTRSKLRHLKCFSPAFSMGAPQFSSNLPVCPVAGRGQ